MSYCARIKHKRNEGAIDYIKYALVRLIMEQRKQQTQQLSLPL